MALSRRRSAPWLLFVTWAAGCNSIFGIEEGTPRREPPSMGGEPPDQGGSTSAGTSHGGSSAGTLDGGAGHAGATNAGAGNAGAPAGGQGGSGGATEIGGGGVVGNGGERSFGGEAGAAGQPDGCDHARWPSRPTPGDASALPDAIVLAANSLVLNQTEVVGRDIDNTCTCPGPSTCTPPGSPDLVCDGSRGRDASVNKVMATVVQDGISAFSEEQLAGELAKGRAGLVLRILGYNGAANDDRVSVELFGKVWTDGALPLHQGNDTWFPYEDSVQFDMAVDWDMDAYVRDSLLVARFPHFSLAFRPKAGNNDNPFVVELEEAVLSGTLEQGSQGFTLKNGNMAARWPTSSFLSAFSVIEYPDWMCENNLAYNVLRSDICKYADIMSAASRDNQAQACDAISWGAGFDAEPAHLGAVKSPPSIESGCPKNWQPSCF
jgi:hypothetical protein